MGGPVVWLLPPYIVTSAQGADRQARNLRRTCRRTAFQPSRLLGNIGVTAPTPLFARFSRPVTAAKPEKRWLDGLYLDQHGDWDNPRRFFRW